MLTYSFENKGTDTLYEYLYKQIKNDILSGKLIADEKLPSKRMLAKNLNISTITVENAYSQLVAEGYIYSVPKSGFYVSRILPDNMVMPVAKNRAKKFSVGHCNKEDYDYDKIIESNIIINNKKSKSEFINEKKISHKLENDNHNINLPKECFADFVSNSTTEDAFPFNTWSKLLKAVMTENANELIARSPSKGIYDLRREIAKYLYQFRGMNVNPSQIIIGAGTEYLYGLLIQLLGYDSCYAVEDPGYPKISRIYEAHNVRCSFVPMDENGIEITALEKSGADIVHISPAHHFPTGLVMPISRRYELLSWASKKPCRYIIEDEYDSEFRLTGKPVPTLQSIDVEDKVIYINTFSKSLSSTIRISYMVLPECLMEKYDAVLSFYSCTVSNIEQYTLAKFIKEGYLEKHINRMRNYYRDQRDRILSCIKKYIDTSKITIREENSGLHFLLELDTAYSDEELIKNAEANGIHISFLSRYYRNTENARQHVLVVNYSGISYDKTDEAVRRLVDSVMM